MALIALAAGATRGSSFVGTPEDQPICLSPLDRDLFTQLQRVAMVDNNPMHVFSALAVPLEGACHAV